VESESMTLTPFSFSAALFIALLLVGGGAIFLEAIKRFPDPGEMA